MSYAMMNYVGLEIFTRCKYLVNLVSDCNNLSIKRYLTRSDGVPHYLLMPCGILLTCRSYGLAAEWALPVLYYNPIGTGGTEAPVTAHQSHSCSTVLETHHTHLRWSRAWKRATYWSSYQFHICTMHLIDLSLSPSGPHNTLAGFAWNEPNML